MRFVTLALLSLSVIALPGTLIAAPAVPLDSFAGLDFSASRQVELPGSALEGHAQSLAVLDLDHDGIDDVAVLRTDGESAELVVRFGNLARVYPHYPRTGEQLSISTPFLGSAGPMEVPVAAMGLLAVDVNLDMRPDLIFVDQARQPISWLASSRQVGELSAPEVAPFAPHWLESIPLLAERLALVGEGADFATTRLGPHAGGDLVAITENGALRFVPRSLRALFTVNSAGDLPDSFDEDGFCDTANNPTTKPPTPPSGVCTLRAAIEQSNFNAGADVIRFVIGGGGAATISVGGGPLEVTGPLTLDATTQAGFAGVPIIHLDFGGGGIFPGLSIMAGPSLVRGFVIGGFSAEGIAIFANDVTVETCYLGTNTAGTAPSSNLRGLGSSGDRSRIGGLAPGAGNLISGNSFGGATLAGNEALFQGNTVGTDVTGSVALANGIFGVGVLLTGNDGVLQKNLVSGHASVGIRIEGDRASVASNRVGTNAAATAAVPNFFAGIYLVGVDQGLIGSELGPASSNIVSGNNGDGIRVAGSTGVGVLGNFVGTDATGQLALGNEFNGIHVEAAGAVPSADIQIGGGRLLGFKFGNLVSGNGSEGWHGIFVEGASTGTIVEGNIVGLNLNATSALGNVVDGIRVQEASGSTIGTASAVFPDPNRVRHNGGAGIAIVDLDAGAGGQNSGANEITVNLLFDNGGLGIDLTRGSATLDGVTLNDAGDADFGPNRLQNFPLISSLTTPSPGVHRISGTLSSEFSMPYDIRIFSSSSCDPSGHGEAEEFVGEVRVTTGAAGFAVFSFDAMTQVNVLTATATNVETSETSELSPCFDPTGGGGGTGRLGNRVWEDVDQDGLQGLDDLGLANVTVRLLNNPGTMVLDTTVTDPAGFYSFDGLASGTYRIEVVPPSGFLPALANVGVDDTVDSDIDASFRTTSFTYTAGSVDLSRDAGLTSLVFADGFESGNVTAWSASVGAN